MKCPKNVVDVNDTNDAYVEPLQSSWTLRFSTKMSFKDNDRGK